MTERERGTEKKDKNVRQSNNNDNSHTYTQHIAYLAPSRLQIVVVRKSVRILGGTSRKCIVFNCSKSIHRRKFCVAFRTITFVIYSYNRRSGKKTGTRCPKNPAKRTWIKKEIDKSNDKHRLQAWLTKSDWRNNPFNTFRGIKYNDIIKCRIWRIRKKFALFLCNEIEP